MCGIAGVISWDEKYRVTRETLQRMSRRIAHRGPDGEGFYLNHEQEVTPDRPQCGFAFRRLAILDPEERAMQPFTIGDKTIVFNGEIYNFRELRAELTKLRSEYRWRTTGDTEVLLLAYDVWGEKCLERLNGMFAFAVWDERDKSLFLVRDRMGQKPLYVSYLYTDGRPAPSLNTYWRLEPPAAVAFASEQRAVAEWAGMDRTVNLRAISDYLRWGYVTATKAVFAGARQIAPADWLKVDRHGGGLCCYFDSTADSPDRMNDAVAARETRRKVELAVKRQLVSDVPVGCFLSGGVDSSVIAASLKAAGAALDTFSMSFDDERYDESEYAAAVARHLGTRHHQFKLTPDAAADLPKLAEVFGEPFGDSSALPTHYLSRETRRHVKVALSGDGGDELFGGYERYRAMRIDRVLRRIPRAVRRALPRLPAGDPKSIISKASRFLASAHLDTLERYESYVRLFPDRLLAAMLLELPPRAVTPFDDPFSGAPRRDPVEVALMIDRMTYLPNDLLTKVDRASMLHGLEVRSPFMDHELVQFAAGLTTAQLLKGGPKRMLREAFADDLPAWVFKRKKMGFAVPIGEWFRGELRPMLRDNLFASDSFARQHFNMKVVERLVEEHETQRADHSQRLYALLMLELWWRTAR
jgi:asparagine synthase (glutamine-hydrolysing)